MRLVTAANGDAAGFDVEVQSKVASDRIATLLLFQHPLSYQAFSETAVPRGRKLCSQTFSNGGVGQ